MKKTLIVAIVVLFSLSRVLSTSALAQTAPKAGDKAEVKADAKPAAKAAAKPEAKAEKKSLLTSEALAGLEFRNIGPALMSGRISDIAIHPKNHGLWYVCAGSGGVWKTENAGFSWSPIFDSQGSYSIGCITLDPSNPEIVWVGTGENVSGRHVGFGDGVYKSLNGGKTWTNMGLAKSEHIGRILVDPRNSDIVYVSAEGPLWAAGGERGLYKSAEQPEINAFLTHLVVKEKVS